MSHHTIKFVTDDDFETQVLKSEVPVQVDFYADWCGPCKAISPFLGELAREFEGKVKIVKLDVDHNVQSTSRFGIRSIPTLLMFAHGMQKDATVGADPTKIRHMVSNATSAGN